ncbi:dTMP kinase [Luteimonas sp. FXH3W]|uniref:Thymidylate kinase n=1 Tax=Aquilutibacter rugosus TaxID=3115820 RepID=A0ABU7UZC4_9GAMM
MLQTLPRMISLEGGEGAGKSTVIALITKVLRELGESVVQTREPGGTPYAEDIRQLLLADHIEAPAKDVEVLLMFAARAQHVRKLILPSIAHGAWVVCDRFTDASFAYQGAARGIDLQKLELLNQQFVGVQPGLTLLLDVDVPVGLARVDARGDRDRIEKEPAAFFEAVRQGYLTRAQAEPERIRVIDANRDPQVVADEVREIVTAYAQRHLSA